MFIIKEYGKYYVVHYYCRTIEKAKEIFDRIFWTWVERATHGIYVDTPQDYDCETWEELLQQCWEDKIWEEVVSYEPLVFEEDKS